MPNDEEDDTFETVTMMADRLKLTGSKRENYIHNHMSDLGYKRVTTRESYVPAKDDDDDEESSDRYLGRRRSSRGSSGRSRRSGDDWD
jgi:hypothetical protein